MGLDDQDDVMVTAPLNNGADSGDIEGGGEIETRTRQAWDSKLQYFFMVISYAVGLGNVWRFPYLTQQHGGGAFLIPYLVMLIVEGLPVLYLELAIGQRLRLGCVGVWNEVHPLLGGLGLASAVTSFMIAIYYNVIIMWCFFYLFNSFQYPLPWSECPTYVTEDNQTLVVEECDISGPTSYFWYRSALDISPGLDESGGMKYKLLGCHVFAWLVIYVCICKGIKSSGKVVYFTATFPYVVLTIFFIKGMMLEGAIDGLKHMFTPKLDQLLNIHCWLDAAAQIFFSFGLAFGGLIAFSSYNPMKNNVEKDTIMVGLTNYFTAIYGCAVIFAIMGFKATLMFKNCMRHNVNILGTICGNADLISNNALECFGFTHGDNITTEFYKEHFENNLTQYANFTPTGRSFRDCDLAEELNEGVSGTGLAFIIFTQAINEFGPSAPFWSIVFFMMLLSLGVGSEFGTIEGVTTSLYDLDLFPWMRKKWLVSGILCFTMCTIGLLFCLGSGSYWVSIFDTYAGSFGLIMIALGECIAIGWVFGVERFGEEIEYMIGKKPHWFWKVCWKYVAPIMIASLLIGIIIIKITKPITYQAYDAVTTLNIDRPYPWYAAAVCVVLVCASIGWLPGVAILRKMGCLKYDHAKVLAADLHRATASTTRFLGSTITTRSEDRDSGHNSDEEVANKEPERPTELALEDIMPAGHRRPTPDTKV